MKRNFFSIRGKFILLLGYFLTGLAALVVLHAYFVISHERLENRYRGSLLQGEISGNILYLVKSMQVDLYELIYRGKMDLRNRILANNEDLLVDSERFSQVSKDYGFDQDYFFLLENESVLLALRADVFRAIALLQEGKRSQSEQLLQQKIEPNIFHVETFIESSNRIRALEVGDYKLMSEQLRAREHLLERIFASGIFLVGLLMAVFISRSIIMPIETLTKQVRDIERSGDWQSRLMSHANDETRLLADAFNGLLERYANAETALASHNEILAQTVKKRTRDLLEAQERLIKKDRLAVLGQITGMVSHELRSPLGTISASMYTLRKRAGGDGGKTDIIFDRVERNIRRCDRIVDELLTFSRSRKVRFVNIEFDAWLGDTLDEYELPELISLQRDLESKATVPLDAEYMCGVIINLLNNAVEAMTTEDGTVVPGSGIRVSTRQSDGYLKCEIADNGPGMSEEVLARVFEPLFTTKTLGIGLGMAAVKRTVEQHGGHLELDSVPSRGTRCTIRLNLQGE